jgi:hypothetical protein
MAKDDLLSWSKPSLWMLALVAVLLVVTLVRAAASDDGPTSSTTAPTRPEFAPVTHGFDPIDTASTSMASSTTATATSPPTVASSTTAPSAPVPTTQAPPPPPIGPLALVDQLVVAPETSGAGYSRDLFAHWIDADHDGCDTRCEVLASEQRTDLPGLTSGWLSIYDGYSTDDPSDLDIDHVVALAEAWRSGADTWDPARRQAFANDLDEPAALIAVTAATNRSKSDKDPARWQPPNRGAWCEFGTAWATVKARWQLTADQAEVGALRNLLAGC